MFTLALRASMVRAWSRLVSLAALRTARPYVVVAAFADLKMGKFFSWRH